MKDSGDYISREALLSATEGYDWKAGLKTVLKRIPAADVRPVNWKSVREHTPEPGRYLVCCLSYVETSSYRMRILSYTDNLESVSQYDFEGVNIPGWFDYDSEYGYYAVYNVEWYMPLPEPPKEEN